MKSIPILMSTPMVRAILDGRKTQTRRIDFKCEPGDILWVRETWAQLGGIYFYKATHKDIWELPWKPSIHMPRKACRLFLEVTEVRKERLQDITKEDALAEGICLLGNNLYGLKNAPSSHQHTAKAAFVELWNTINAKRGYGWAANPVVDVITFRRVER